MEELTQLAHERSVPVFGYNALTWNTAGGLTFDCGCGPKVHINSSTADRPPAHFLDDEEMDEFDDYVGTLIPIRLELPAEDDTNQQRLDLPTDSTVTCRPPD